MADKSTEKKDKDQTGQDVAMELRQAISNAYGFVKGQEASKGFAALTFEDLMDRQIETISGNPGNGRLNQIDRIKRTANQVREMAIKVKAIDPSAFDTHNEESDVNTEK